jgi:UDP-glucose 4-epimerase
MCIEAVIKNSRDFSLGNGQNIWDHVHVTDLADAFIKRMKEALKPHGGNADWGMEGYMNIVV